MGVLGYNEWACGGWDEWAYWDIMSGRGTYNYYADTVWHSISLYKKLCNKYL